jgi:diguanylate cyclase
MTRADHGATGEASSLNALAQQWLRRVKAAGFVPGKSARARALLRELLQQLVAAVRAEPFDASVGRRVGMDLVAGRMADPGVLGVSLPLLADRLPALIQTNDPVMVRRITTLLGQLAQGFTDAVREDAAEIYEEMLRSERIVWRDQEARLQGRLHRARLHDIVTDLPNRVYLREWLRTAIASAYPGSRMGLCLLRIDDFSGLNDALGHDTGDKLLDTIGLRLRELVTTLAQGTPATDEHPGAAYRYHLAHLGGEHFVITMIDTASAEEVIKVARLAREAICDAKLPWVDGYELKLTTSAGIVEGPITPADADDWLRNAHVALAWTLSDHQPYAVFNPGRAQKDLNRHRLAATMPAALQRGEFEPYFQPQFQLTDHTIIGVEALARWKQRGHPAPAPSPQEFIDLAEHTGLIRPLGQALLRRACHHGNAWRTAGHHLLISVNLSPLQLAEPDLAASIQDILHRTGLPPEALQLEITESAAVNGPAGVLNELVERGIRLAIDDFGTGHANLAALAQLPVTTVKLARELVTGLHDHHNLAAASVVQRTIQLCHDLNLTVTAEGIETPTQYATLRALGCDYGQGYLLAKPANAHDTYQMLQTHQRHNR